MDTISYEALEKNGFEGFLQPRDAPEKVLQFGEGNFLRAFVDRYFDMGAEATGWLCGRHQRAGLPLHRAHAWQAGRRDD